MLCPRDSHRLEWNRFHKPKFGLGGNILLDLAMEHYSNFIKNLMRKLRPNATNRTALDQLTKALTCNKKLLNNYDTMCSVINDQAGMSSDQKRMTSGKLQLSIWNTNLQWHHAGHTNPSKISRPTLWMISTYMQCIYGLKNTRRSFSRRQPDKV